MVAIVQQINKSQTRVNAYKHIMWIPGSNSSLPK